jgi:opacity protein-like surface antigen
MYIRRVSSFAFLVAAALAAVPSTAAAQTADVPRIEVSALPGGVVAFTEGDSGAPSFVNYALVGAVAFNINRYVGVEGEFGGSFGFDQDLDFATGTVSGKPPHQLTYSGNLIVHVAGIDRRVAPYVAGGAGGMTVLERADVGVSDSTNLFVANAGGGVKFRLTDRLGFRADDRFLAAVSQDDGPAFFGIEDRYGHRVTAGVVFSFPR